MLSIVLDPKVQAQKGMMCIRKPLLTNKRTLEEDDDRLERKGSNSQSQVSFKVDKDKRHSRIIKKVHRLMPVKPRGNEVISFDPRMSCTSMAMFGDSYQEEAAQTQTTATGSQNSLVFNMDNGADSRGGSDFFGNGGYQYLNYDPINQELIMGATPIQEKPQVDSEMAPLDLEGE